MQDSISEQLDLFNPVFNSERLPHKPYCKDEKSAANLIRSLKSALRRPYISINPPKLRFWSIYDIDRLGGGLAWEDGNLPAPAWAAINKENGHAHLAYGLSAPVLTGDGGREAPLRYLAAIESGFRARLGADQAFVGPITKNPSHPLWRTLWGPAKLFELGELAEWVDLPKHMPKRGMKVENVGLGRNCTLFDRMRSWAYVAVRAYRGERGLMGWNAWLEEVRSKAEELNGDFSMSGGEWHSQSGPMGNREVYWVAKSVATYCWKHDAKAHAEFIQRQAFKGRKGGIAKGLANENKQASARLLRMACPDMSMRQIANELDVNINTVRRWLSAMDNDKAVAHSPDGQAVDMWTTKSR